MRELTRLEKAKIDLLMAKLNQFVILKVKGHKRCLID
jgi:hypothetical protein